MIFPKMMRIRQNFAAPVLKDVTEEVLRQTAALKLEEKVKAGESVAVACSSRGIANYSNIVRAAVQVLKKLGLNPFLFPAMGSHGAATAEGQRKVLENCGITEGSMGVSISSSLEVVQIGETEDAIPVYLDKLASQADYIVPVNRVKSHTEFEHRIESGLMKMLAIGMGKQKGASIYHQGIMVHGYPHVIESVARTVLETGKILFGVGIVENGLGQTAKLGVISPEELENKEKGLLSLAKKLAARLPFDDVDILIIDEMGKDISGTGFDTKVVGRIGMPLVASEPESPRVKRIVVCDLTDNTEGNADGIGLADFVTRRLVDKIDMDALKVNAITGAEPEHARIPMALDNDREALKVAIGSVGLIPTDKLKIIRIKNTMKLAEIEISTAYKENLDLRKDLEVIADEKIIKFNPEDNFEPL